LIRSPKPAGCINIPDTGRRSSSCFPSRPATAPTTSCWARFTTGKATSKPPPRRWSGPWPPNPATPPTGTGWEKLTAGGPRPRFSKAYGRRAETSIFFRAPAYARKCHQAFEKAVQLDPENLEAINDLFSYYLDAPGWLGGGLRKAEALAERIGRLDEAEYQYAEAQLAKKRKQYAAAERHLRRAVELEPGDVGRRIDLAEFLADRGRLQESDEVFERAREIAPDSPKLWFAMARTYIKEKRRPAEARRLLEQYLAAELTPEDPPRAEARRLLDKVKGG